MPCQGRGRHWQAAHRRDAFKRREVGLNRFDRSAFPAQRVGGSVDFRLVRRD
jgi:hypothetical protein